MLNFFKAIIALCSLEESNKTFLLLLKIVCAMPSPTASEVDLTLTQLNDISKVERACSVISLIGSLFIITTFCISNRFRKAINRMVFYATFGNVITNVGTLISRAYIEDPTSIGCQAQAFLIQTYV